MQKQLQDTNLNNVIGRETGCLTVPDALSRAFAAFHEVMGDRYRPEYIWHEVEHGKFEGEVLKVTTPARARRCM